ncbi:hypothetical protein CDL15_Pgr011569 [Punica granatum]|uniref:Myb/SANT-like domain-containing protein n=1 Tax=Punica granatum TaxID=22663 RepID=A0A218Y1U7_PUNGR|nr:hypothetical protein CDL15_Pgr011569 [Punica granatum]PKI39010.1 hypothetical protein CRG98_040608 [Punica granatum]
MSRKLEEKFPGVILGADKVKTKAQRLKTQYTRFTEPIQHTGVGWDGPTNTVKANPDIWDKFIKRHSNFRTFRSKGCKHYEALKLMCKSNIASGGLRISSTDPPQSPRSYACIEEEFLASRNSRGKEPIDLAEGSADSDDPTHEADEPVVTGSRRESKTKKDKAKNSTPSESKSKSVMGPEKPAWDNIVEAMDVLNKMKGTISVREYLAGTA